eukprot:c19363_g1_i1.p1 GENE.c19363_g1_i1~~c19363_g1_i1.p1  ORF type:complete len:332 (+),score=58.34 c19363_g1_i1:109-1104(+)
MDESNFSPGQGQPIIQSFLICSDGLVSFFMIFVFRVVFPQQIVGAHSCGVYCLDASLDRPVTASGDEQGNIIVYNSASKTVSCAFSFFSRHTIVTAIKLSPDASCVLASSYATLKLWDLSSGTSANILQTFVGHRGWVYCLDVCWGGPRLIVSGCADRTVKVWSLDGGAPLHTLVGHSHWVSTVALTKDGETCISGSFDSMLMIWSTSTGVRLHTLVGHARFVKSVAISADDRFAASYGFEGSVRVWDLEHRTTVKRLVVDRTYVNKLVFTPNHRYLLAITDDGTIREWDTQRFSLLSSVKVHTGRSYSIAISSQKGSFVTAGAQDGIVKF